MGTRVVLVDSQPLVRSAVCALIGRMASCEVVGEASDGEEALTLIEDLAPDLAILELMLPGLPGTEVVRRAKQRGIRTQFLFLAVRERCQDIENAFAAGARGFVTKHDSTEELLTAIERVARGQIHLTSAATGHLAEMVRKRRGCAISHDQLSSREREILRLIAEGLSSREVASALNLSVHTVDSHRANLMDKLEIRKVAGLVRYAIRAGFVHP